MFLHPFVHPYEYAIDKAFWDAGVERVVLAFAHPSQKERNDALTKLTEQPLYSVHTNYHFVRSKIDLDKNQPIGVDLFLERLRHPSFHPHLLLQSALRFFIVSFCCYIL
jgi:hypothetical protein